MIIDATDAILGRLAARVAKKLISGEQVIIVNAEKAVVSGTPRKICEKYLEKRKRGSAHHGPFYPRYPDRIVWRTIRGMLPYKKPKGRAALKRLKVYTGQPQKYQNAEKIIKTKDKLRCRSVTIKEVSKFMGAKLG